MKGRTPTYPRRRDPGGTHRASSPLTKEQKRDLSQCARRAFDQLIKVGALEPAAGMSPSAVFKGWKHEEQARVLGGGRTSLNEAMQRDVRNLWVHFLGMLKGVPDATARAYDLGLESETEDEARRQAFHHLALELRKAGLTEGYARTIARSRWKDIPFEQLPAALITSQLLPTIRNRGEQKRASQA